jgi:DNA-binding response OmpR family regulator
LGSTFKIYLPAAASRSDRAHSTRTPEVACYAGTETLLLVEDEAPVRHAECEFLTRIGYTVLEAENGAAALHVAREYAGCIHLLVSDVVMPNLGGPQLAEQLAVERPSMQVLFVSGYAEATILRCGVINLQTHFLQKPFSLRTLSAKIRGVLPAQASAARAAG